MFYATAFAPSAIFWPNAVAIKSIDNDLRKCCSALAPKMLLKLTQGKGSFTRPISEANFALS
jgi:hypothetical protein